jgi:myo-inositol-1(or 4)-monophosphatase
VIPLAPNSAFWTDVLEFSQATSHRLGERLNQDFYHTQAAEKEDGSLVTPSDEWADQELRRAITSRFPEHGFLSEESEHIFPETEWCWIVDPIDGTTNFARGIPIWGISMALLYKGVPVFAYIHFPPLAQTFHGFFGKNTPQGAYLNHQPITCSRAEPGSNQLFNFCSRSTHLITRDFPCKVRMLGGAAYNMLLVASGTFLGAVEQSPKVWDIAGVWVVVKAAGGVWIGLDREDPFPLMPGVDYGRKAHRTLLLSREALIPVFQGRMQVPHEDPSFQE